VVTSTGAQAAQRLADELSTAGVSAVAGCSTRALQAAVARGSVVLSPEVTIIHDEAALASTREQAWLLQAAAGSGARIIEVGDPRQSHAVGAGGLWPHIEHAAADRGGLVELSRIVRARDAADRRDQARWRAGEHDQALAGYATRGRVVIDMTQRQAEDRALEAAHEDRRAGHTSLVVVQTSNEQLDGLNARAQALRVQDAELGGRQVALTGRPYGLYAGDEVVLRAASVHPQLGAVRNGTRGRVLDVGGDQQTAVLQFADGRQATWDRSQLNSASARLAYVSHTFPAQGQTVDRAHVIVAEHSDANGTYVALTRAREHTRIYASAERLELEEPDTGRDAQVAALAQRLGRTEVEVPSIAVPLAYEQQIEHAHAREQATRPDPRAPDPHRVAKRPPEPDQLAGLRSERDRLRAIVDSYPADTVREIARLDSRASGERELADGDTGRAIHWQGVYEQFGVFGRRGQQGREARDRAEQFAVRAERQHEHADQLQTRARALADSPDGPRMWEQANPGVRERLHAAETELAAEVDRRAHEPVEPTTPAQARGSDRAAHDQLAWLRQERDRLAAELDGYPRHHAHTAQQADRRAERAVEDAQAARDRAARAERELSEMGRLARHGQRGSSARERQQAAEQQAGQHTQRAETERSAARQAREQPGGPLEWERAHPGVRDRLAVYEHALEVGTEQQTRRALARDPAIAVRALGPRPRPAEQREIWDQGARAISAYRLAYQVTDRQHVLGPEPDRASAHGLEQHHDWEHAARLALQARRELSVGPDRGIGPVAEQVRHVAELTPTHPDRGPDRGFGR
jgi:hypothetical protein